MAANTGKSLSWNLNALRYPVSAVAWRVTLTSAYGAPDDYLLAATSLSVYVDESGAGYFRVSAPLTTELQAAVAAHPSSALVLDVGLVDAAGNVIWRTEVFTLPVTDYGYSQGATSQTATLTASGVLTGNTPETRTVHAVLEITYEANKRNFRVALADVFRWGDVANVAGELITVGQVRIDVSERVAQVSFREA